MSLTFRPDMKVIIHEVDGRPVRVSGKSIEIGSSALAAMVEVFDDTELRLGAKARCSYVEPAGVQSFDTVVIASDPLTLNHRLVRVVLASPAKADRIQRREHVRVDAELAARVVRRSDGAVCRTTTVDLSAGGMALVWPGEVLPEIGEELQIGFATDRFEHDHRGIVVGSTPAKVGFTLRVQFVDLSAAERDRLVSAVFAYQRAALRAQRDAAKRR